MHRYIQKKLIVAFAALLQLEAIFFFFFITFDVIKIVDGKKRKRQLNCYHNSAQCYTIVIPPPSPNFVFTYLSIWCAREGTKCL